MKRILLVVSVLLSAALYAEGNIVEVRGGVDLGGQYNVEGNLLNKDVKFSYELAVEYRREVARNFELGAGIAYQDHGKLKSKTVGDFTSNGDLHDSVPLYATARYNFKNSTEVTPYVKLNLGYSFNVNDGSIEANDTQEEIRADIDAKDGFYYGIGAGVEYKGFIADLSYQRNSSKVDLKNSSGISSSDGNADYSRVTLGLGYNFGF